MIKHKTIESWVDHVDSDQSIIKNIKRVSNIAWAKCDSLIVKCRNTDNVIVHRKALSKYVAYLALRNIVSITLFHWIYWRLIYGFKSPEWIDNILRISLHEDSIESNHFFASWGYIRQNHLITTETSKMVNIMTTEAKQGSEVDTIL